MDELINIENVIDTDSLDDLNKIDGSNIDNKLENNEEVKEEIKEEIKEEKSFSSDKDIFYAALDGLLLVHNKPISYERLSEVLEISMEDTEKLVLERKKQYDDDPKCGMQIAILENGVQLATKARISHFIQRLDGQKLVSLSLPALETLSVIAFKQPITKAEIDAIRGVDSGGVVGTLLEKKLIYVSGEKQVTGKPRLYSTTQDFLYYFGMNSLKELPVPTIDINEAMMLEEQKGDNSKQKEAEKDFNVSQGFVPIEKSNESQELSENEIDVVDKNLNLPESVEESSVDFEIENNLETQKAGE